jgi:catalase
MKAPIERENNYGQAGERYRTISDWEREDLVKNLVAALRQCQQEVRERMLAHLSQCDAGLGSRVASGIGAPAAEMTNTEDVRVAEGYGASADPR